MRPPGPGRVAAAALVALAVAMGIGRFAYTPILPAMQADYGLGARAGAALAAWNYAGYLAGSLAAVGMRLRPRAAIGGSLAAIAAVTAAMALPLGMAGWSALRAIAGVASALALVSVSAWALERLAAFGRPRLAGRVFAGVGTGIVVAGLACLALFSAHAPAQAAWLVLAAVALAGTAFAWPALGASPAALVPARFPRADADRRFWRLVACYGAFGYGYIIPATFLPAMAKAVLPDPRAYGWIWPIFGAAAVASTLLGARLGATGRPLATWIGSTLVLAFGVAVPIALPGAPGLVLSATCVGGTFMVLTMAAMQVARDAAGEHAPTYIAAMTAAFAAGQALGPAVVAALAGRAHGLALALGSAAAVLVAAAAWLAAGAARSPSGRKP